MLSEFGVDSINQSKKQVRRFILAGICSVATDCLVYYLLTNYLPANIAKGISFLTGTSVAYLINKYYTFEQTKKSISEVFKFLALYLTTLSFNIVTNALVLHFSPIILSNFDYTNPQLVKLFGFLCATGVSTILNFIGQKFWVFKMKGAVK